ncbi:hypothetical protein MAR_026667 [Mya arenaria]|uniref:Uncharacterized protein n=1 Tax=Mya arenaria TaxID=6604 RepID=A0ABY7ER66_MYAAR|nr:hypothetical protein MAR_026667 [Mya arenaria]
MTDLGCGDCIVIGHRTCKVDYIADVSKDFTNGSEFREFEPSIKRAEDLLSGCISKVKELFDEVEHQSKDEIDRLRRFRTEINTYLDRREKELLGNIQKMKTEDESVLTELKTDCELAKSGLVATRTELTSGDVSDNQRYVTARRVQKELREIHDKMEKMAGRMKARKYRFVKDPNTEGLLGSKMGLGSLDVAEDDLGCGDCIVIGHRTCKVDYIADVSKDFTNGSEFRELEPSIKRAEDGCISKVKELFDEVEHQSKDEIDRLRRFRTDINTYLDRREKELLGNVQKMKTEDESALTEIKTDCELAKSGLVATRTELTSGDVSDNQRYVTARRIQKELREIHDKMEDGRMKARKYRFVKDADTEGLLGSKMGLGSLDLSEEFAWPVRNRLWFDGLADSGDVFLKKGGDDGGGGDGGGGDDEDDDDDDDDDVVEYRELEPSIKRAEDLLSGCISEVKELFEEVEHQSKDEIDRLRKFRADINTYLDRREKELLGNIQKMKTDDERVLAELKTDCELAKCGLVATRT